MGWGRPSLPHRPIAHRAVGGSSAAGRWGADAERDPFRNRPCYEFHHALGPSADDQRCVHCRHYLTFRCRHLDEFLDDVEDLEPE